MAQAQDAAPRQRLEAIFRAGLERVAPLRMMREHLQLKADILTAAFENERYEIDLAPFKRIIVLGAGKATAPMAQAFEQILGQRIDDGLVVVKEGHTAPLERIRSLEAAHPVPDERGVRAAAALRAMAREADKDTLVITLISGGGSALLPAPLSCSFGGQRIDLSLADKQQTTKALLRCGAAIHEINCIRKHLSELKGGRLLQAIAPARSVNFILSDVVGDDLSSIASGLTSSDPTSYDQALGILEKYGIAWDVPEKVLDVLRAGARGEIPETLKPGAPEEGAAANILIGTNAGAMAAAGEQARRLGYTLAPLTARISGEAREVARMLAAMAADVASHSMLAKKPACLISGGEPVVTLQGRGKGGRNQELALAFLAEMQQNPELYQGVTFLAASTDGNDGPTDAAGAYASLDLLARAEQKGLNVHKYLRENDSYTFFKAIDGLCTTGPTNTNVCDLHMVLVE